MGPDSTSTQYLGFWVLSISLWLTLVPPKRSNRAVFDFCFLSKFFAFRWLPLETTKNLKTIYTDVHQFVLGSEAFQDNFNKTNFQMKIYAIR